MKQHEVDFAGVYRLTVNGKLVGEFVPGPIWSAFYKHAQETYENVSCSWEPFEVVAQADATPNPENPVMVEYRTASIETLPVADYWYQADNEQVYENMAAALERSDVITDWRSQITHSLTSVRVIDQVTQRATYISPTGK